MARPAVTPPAAARHRARSPHAFRSTPPRSFSTCCTVCLAALAALAFGAFAQAALAANPQVEFDTTAGKIRVELYPEAAPKTVANFLDYVKAKHYDGTQFHRVIDGFMIQGGGFTGDFSEKPTRPPVVNEAEHGEQGRRCVNAAERYRWRAPATPTRPPPSSSSTSTTTAVLNYRSPDPQGIGYTVFGKVVAGMDVVDQDREGAQGRRQAGPAGNAPRPARRADRTRHHQQGLRRRSQIGKAMIVLHTSHGAITLELDAENAPKTVENFLQYVRDGHYDNTVFHRVIPGFMIQGGGMEPGMKQKRTRAQIANEAGNGLKNKRYTVAMARTNEPHSATAQFFINIADNDFLDHKGPSPQGWGYCVFGKVTAGQDVVDRIAAVATGDSGFHQNVPTEDVVIQRAEEKA